jgi:hypothetical protein
MATLLLARVQAEVQALSRPQACDGVSAALDG